METLYTVGFMRLLWCGGVFDYMWGLERVAGYCTWSARQVGYGVLVLRVWWMYDVEVDVVGVGVLEGWYRAVGGGVNVVVCSPLQLVETASRQVSYVFLFAGAAGKEDSYREGCANREDKHCEEHISFVGVGCCMGVGICGRVM